MNMKFAIIMLISLASLSTQAQNLEIQEISNDLSLKDIPNEIATENLNTMPDKLQKDFHKGILEKDSEEEENFPKITKAVKVSF